MRKNITFTWEDKEYTLEFTRRSVEKMERQGFKVNNIGDRPMSALPELFHGAFLAHHPAIKKETTDKIFSCFTKKEELLEALAQMYNAPLEALLDEPEDETKNVEWEKSF